VHQVFRFVVRVMFSFFAVAASFAAPQAPLAGPPALMALPQGRVAWATIDRDAGEVDAGLQLTHLVMLLKRAPERQQAFEELLRQQQDPDSPNFHQWLTATEVGERFGLAAGDVETVTAWLREQGLKVDSVSNSRTRITFSGSAARMSAAFATPLRTFAVNGEKRIAPAAFPRVPAAIADKVLAIHGLETVHELPHLGREMVGFASPVMEKQTNCSSGTCLHYIWPSDFAVIYDVNQAYQNGINGSGQTIAVIGRANVYMPDIENFQKRAGLPVRDPVTIIPPGGLDPGPPTSAPVSDPSTIGDQREATLDVTRAAGVAPGANIDLIISAGSKTVSGLGVAGAYAVDTVPVPAHIMTISFGLCEQDAGQSAVQFWDNIFSQAAAEGISVFVSSGDSGVAGCSDQFKPPPATQTASPNYICSSSYATCVGGTQFADTANPTAYWRATNTPGFESALSYIPEGAWNEPFNSANALQVAGTGGGVSAFIPMPSWQASLGVPGAPGRFTPDVSFTAASHDPYVKCQAATGGDCVPDSTGAFHFTATYGTSASTPSMAGIAALLNQKMEAPQGNLNPRIYALAASGTSGLFHDVTVATSGVSSCDVTVPSLCNNSTAGPDAPTTGLPGFLVGSGYDLATGLGSLDTSNFLAAYGGPSASTPTYANYQGLWWASPASSESGWGVNFAHQGDTIFGTWFTYDLSGTGNWLVMTAQKLLPNTYLGTLYATRGPAFNAVPFNPQLVTAAAVGSAIITFTGANDGTFAYTIGSTWQTKSITREVFGAMPTCEAASSPASLTGTTNYTDLWWAAPGGSESGWGINLNHEGTTIFATWFTYDTTGAPMWLVVTATQNQAQANNFTGSLYRTTGPAFSAVPFDPAKVAATLVGAASFTFTDGNNARFAYTVSGTSQAKNITREVFGGNGTVCH
jgi:pseudomonalisin